MHRPFSSTEEMLRACPTTLVCERIRTVPGYGVNNSGHVSSSTCLLAGNFSLKYKCVVRNRKKKSDTPYDCLHSCDLAS